MAGTGGSLPLAIVSEIKVILCSVLLVHYFYLHVFHLLSGHRHAFPYLLSCADVFSVFLSAPLPLEQARPRFGRALPLRERFPFLFLKENFHTPVEVLPEGSVKRRGQGLTVARLNLSEFSLKLIM